MRRATLSNPPLFALTERAPGRVTLTADTGAVAHLFVLEDDIARLLLLADGQVTSPPSWAIAPGDRAAFRGALTRLMAEPQTARAVRAAEARAFARTTFDPEHQVSAYLELFRTLVAPPAA